MYGILENIPLICRHSIRVATADVAIERQTKCVSSSLGSSQRNTEDSVSTELALGWSAVESQHLVVECTLIENTVALKCRSDDVVNVLNSLQCTLAQVAVLVTVAEFESLVLAC